MTTSAASWPDAVILFGARALLSLVAIVCLAFGHWRSERQWDDQGAAVYDQRDGDDDVYSRMEMDSYTTAIPPPPPPVPEVLRSKRDPPQYRQQQQQGQSQKEPSTKNESSSWSDWTKNLPTRMIEQLPGLEPDTERPSPTTTRDLQTERPPPMTSKDSQTERVSRVMEQAWPVSKVTVAGWMMLAVSTCLDRASWYKWEFQPLVGVNLLLIGFLAVVQAVWLRSAMLRRVVHKDSYFLAACWLGCLLLEGILTSFLDPDAPKFASAVGAACVALSTVVMWWSRKMGNSFDVHGEPNRASPVYTLGGPLAAGGWLFFWIGMNAVHASPDTAFLPLFWSGKTVISFTAAALVTVVLFAMNYAHDEQEIAVLDDGKSRRDFYGLEFPGFGRFEKFKTALVLCWMLWGGAALLPYIVGTLPIFVFLLCAFLGVAIGIFHDQAVRTGSVKAFRVYSAGIGGMLTLWWLLLTLMSGVSASLLALTGLLLAVAGSYLLHGDAKRGRAWMETQRIKENATAYSYGALLFPLGLFLVAWGMSFP